MSRYGAAKKLYEDAKYNIDFVEIGKGVHNPFYAAELIQVADRDINQIFRLLNQPPPQLPPQSLIRGGYCAKLCHAKAQVQLPTVASFEGDKFPHARHAFEFDLGCTSCHSPEKHKEIKISKKDCLACHHSPENKQCSRCHQKQAALYTAQKLPIEFSGAQPNIKANKVNCVQCHNLSQRQTIENISITCKECHDQAYGELLKVIKTDLQNLEQETGDLLRKVNKKLKSPPRNDPQIKELNVLFQKAKKSYEFILQAKGVHNINLAQDILKKTQEDLKKVAEHF